MIDGYDRITTVLNYFSTPEYVKWVGKVGNKESKRSGTVAMKIGTEADEWIKSDIQGLKLPKLKSEEAKNCVKGYQQWVKEYTPQLTVGQRVFDDTLMVTGEPDILTDTTVIDIKCSLVIRPVYWLQTEFYARKTGKFNKAILRLDKHLGVYEYDVRVIDDRDMMAVAGLVEAYRFFNREKSVTDGEEQLDVTDTNSTNSTDES